SLSSRRFLASFVLDLRASAWSANSFLRALSALNSHPPHPGKFLRHTGIGSTLSLTDAHVSALSTCKGILAATSTRVDSHRLADDQTIFNQLPDLLTGVGIGDLVGIQPYFLLAAAQHAGGEPLLQSEHAHGGCSASARKGKTTVMKSCPLQREQNEKKKT
uniref:Uncharacterized protein n=1 Tax=Leptobrachium leishanense TaxID=445787 RepID=A0A8C5PJI4_9ANUR